MKMNKWTCLLSVVTLIGFSQASFAMDGSSGCGPGWYAFKDNSLVSSSLRNTTNNVLIPVVTIGMTIGTSNCTKHSIVETEKESLHFAAHNFFELKGDIAKGQGAYVNSFASTIGCTVKAQTRFATELKNNYKAIFSHSEQKPENALKEVYKVILSDDELSNECSLHQWS